MKKYILRLFVGFSLLLCFSLVRSQSSNNLTLLSNWTGSNLSTSSGLTYNEIWGWADTTNGREYAIIGTLAWTFFIDITDPNNPVVADSVAGGHSNCIHRDFKTYKNYCYGVADEGSASTLQVIDMSYLPDSVHMVFDSNTFFRRAHNIYIDEGSGHLYAVGTNTLSQGAIVLDIATNPEVPTLLSNVNISNYSHDLFVRNDTAWMNDGPSGMKVFDYTNVTNPIQIGIYAGYSGAGYNHSCWLTEDSDYLVMCDETHNTDVKLLDVSDVSNISQASFFRSALLAPVDTASIPHNPYIVGDYALVGYYHDGVQIWDISNPNSPQHIAWYDTYTNHSNYGGYKGVWGLYPFLPSGRILASDTENGLYVFGPNFPFPSIVQTSISMTPIVCYGDSTGIASISASGGAPPYHYQWSTGDSTSTVSTLSGGTHYVTITDGNGNGIVDTILMQQPPAYTTGFSVTHESCPGTADGQIDMTVSGGTPGYSYQWSTGDQVEDVSGLTATTYYVTVTDSSSCQLIDSVVIQTLAAAPQSEAGQDSVICEDNMQLYATPPGGNQTGEWMLGSGNGSFSQTNAYNTMVTDLALGTNELVWVISDGNCSQADTLVVNVSSTAFVDAGEDTTICATSLMLNGSNPGQGSGQWASIGGGVVFSAANNPSSSASGFTPGSYLLTWTVSEGICSRTDTLEINVDLPPVAAFTNTGIVVFTVTFSDLSQNANQWLWDFGDGGSSTFQNPIYTYTNGGQYQVCLTATGDCGTDSTCSILNVFPVGVEENISQNSLRSWPNPGSQVIHLEAKGLSGANVAGNMRDLQGRLVRSFEAEVLNGEVRIDLKVADLAKGAYWIELEDGSRTLRVLQMIAQ